MHSLHMHPRECECACEIFCGGACVHVPSTTPTQAPNFRDFCLFGRPIAPVFCPTMIWYLSNYLKTHLIIRLECKRSAERMREEHIYWDYLESAINAMIQLFIIAGVGAFLARIGLMADESFRKGISQVCSSPIFPISICIYFLFLTCATPISISISFSITHTLARALYLFLDPLSSFSSSHPFSSRSYPPHTICTSHFIFHTTFIL